MKIPLGFLFLFLITINIYGQDTTRLTRSPYTLKVLVDKKNYYEAELKEAPFVLPDNTVQLYPGEAVFLEIEQKGRVITNVKAVKEIKDSSKTVVLSFMQVSKKKVHESMTLSVTNYLPGTLVYKATIYLLEQKKWISTNVFPVDHDQTGYEIWPYVITSIGLGSWSFE